MKTKKAELYLKKYWMGEEVSEYGLDNGYIDYRCLSNIVGNMILCNTIYNVTFEDWEIENGIDCRYYDESGNEITQDEYNENGGDYEQLDIYQCYIIDDNGADFLKRYTDEIVYYNEKLDLYLWGVTHWGTSWDYVLTDIEIVTED